MTRPQLEETPGSRNLGMRGLVSVKGNRVAQKRFQRCSKSVIANGAASARFPRAAIACAMNFATTMPSGFSRSKRSTPRSRRSASAGRLQRDQEAA